MKSIVRLFSVLFILASVATARADVSAPNAVGNLFNGVATVAGTRSAAIDILHNPFTGQSSRNYTILGNTSTSAKFDLYESPDCVDWGGAEFPGGAAAAHWIFVNTTTVSGDFSFKLTTDAYCVALIARGTTTITASLFSR